jgi:hypothetical protein
MEYWNGGMMGKEILFGSKPNVPIFQYSNIPVLLFLWHPELIHIRHSVESDIQKLPILLLNPPYIDIEDHVLIGIKSERTHGRCKLHFPQCLEKIILLLDVSLHSLEGLHNGLGPIVSS